MIKHEGLDRNFQFLVLEVRKQLEATYRLFEAPSQTLIRSVLSRDNYADTLKSLIEKKCISFFRHTPTIDKPSANLVTAIGVVTTNLERIGDFCVNIAGQIQRISDRSLLAKLHYTECFDSLLDGVGKVDAAIANSDASLALELCRVEAKLDEIYGADLTWIREQLSQTSRTDDYVWCLFIVHYLERMGDSLLNIGESVLFAATGEKLKLHEYMRVREVLGTEGDELLPDDISVNFEWETKSGCRIAKVEDRSDGSSDLEAIFKKGQGRKLHRERENIERWEKIAPGVPPKVLEFREGHGDAALLLEFLDGETLRDLAIRGEEAVAGRAMEQLEATLFKVWGDTRQPTQTNASFLKQLAVRLPDVFRLHPEFKNADIQFGDLNVAGLEVLLEHCSAADALLPAPFSVVVHGDLNTDNIIFDRSTDRLHLIDLYRSNDSDYVQDVSVFLVSNFRVPVFDGAARDLLDEVSLRMLEFASRFAERYDDPTFHARLALGLARSFITSTRFEIDADFSRIMAMRAVYLLEKIALLKQSDYAAFRVSAEVLTY